MSQIEEARPFFKIRAIGRLVPCDLPHQTVLLLLPGLRHLGIERTVDPAVQLIDIGCVNTFLQTIVFTLQARNRRLMFPLLVAMAVAQRLGQVCQHIIAKGQTAQDFGELLADDFLAHVRLVTFSFVPGAMIVHVAAFLKLADHRAPTVTALHQARECEVARVMSRLACVPAFQNALHPFPQLAGNKWLMTAFVPSSVPVEVAGVEPSAQNLMDVAGRKRPAGTPVNQA